MSLAVRCFCQGVALSVVVGEAQSVIVLTENEFVAIDLTSDGWPLHRVPYLLSTSAWSSVTCVQHASTISDAVWNNIVTASNADVGHWSMKVCSESLVGLWFTEITKYNETTGSCR